MKGKYTFHKDFYIRTPSLSLDFYYDLVNCEVIEDQKFKDLWNDDFIKDAIYIASIDLYNAIEEWTSGVIRSEQRIRGIRNKFLSYLIRMSSRCTPFGLFAGVGIGTFSHLDKIVRKADGQQKRKTRFDMHFLCNVWNHLSAHPDIKSRSNFEVNNTLYNVSDHYRYIRHRNNSEHLEYFIGGVKKTEILNDIIQKLNSTISYIDLMQHVMDQGFTDEEASRFIDSLIDAQILVSEHSPQVTGEDNLQSICKTIKHYNPSKELICFEESAFGLLSKLDKPNYTHSVQDYNDIEEAVKTINVHYKKKHLIQTDLYHEFEEASLNKKYAFQLLRALYQVSSLSELEPQTTLNEFKNKFQRRYDQQLVPLNQVLDVEMGIGYGKSEGWYNSGFVQQISEQLNQPINKSYYGNQNLKNEIRAKSKSHVQEIDISHLIKKSEVDHHQYFGTSFFVMVELLDNGGNMMMHPKFLGTPAAALLSRFTHLNDEMKQSIQELIDSDGQDEREIVAEIIHLPQSRVGNILYRATTRKYEIPYCSKSSRPNSHQIPVQDIMVGVRNGQVSLHSKKYNKTIIPIITSAHNYKNKPLPIYEFLCDLSKQNIQLPHFDSLIDTKNLFFSPRITLRNIILKKAQWNLSEKSVEELNSIITGKSQLKEMRSWRDRNGVPQYVSTGYRDTIIPINLDNQNCLYLLKGLLKYKTTIIFSEFVKPAKIVRSQNGDSFTNELVFAYKRGAILDS